MRLTFKALQNAAKRIHFAYICVEFFDQNLDLNFAIFFGGDTVMLMFYFHILDGLVS